MKPHIDFFILNLKITGRFLIRLFNLNWLVVLQFVLCSCSFVSPSIITSPTNLPATPSPSIEVEITKLMALPAAR
jgi:hypothetical protein